MGAVLRGRGSDSLEWRRGFNSATNPLQFGGELASISLQKGPQSRHDCAAIGP